MVVDEVAGPHWQHLQSLLALASRQGYVTWRQLAAVQADSEAATAILDALLQQGVELIDDPEDVAKQERAYEAHLAEMRRKPCWQLGDGWHFAAEVLPYPCQSTAPSTFRLRCGYSLDHPPVPEDVAYRVWAAPARFADNDPPDEFWQLPWEPVAHRMVSPTELRLSLPAGVVFIQFRVAQPDYRPEPWRVSPWRLEVG
jgi:hypothetical protein